MIFQSKVTGVTLGDRSIKPWLISKCVFCLVLDGAELYEKQYFDTFMRDVIFNVANISIIVVNDVTLNDQIYLDAVRKNLKRMHMNTMAGERSGGEELSNSQDVSGKSDDDAIK